MSQHCTNPSLPPLNRFASVSINYLTVVFGYGEDFWSNLSGLPVKPFLFPSVLIYLAQ